MRALLLIGILLVALALYGADRLVKTRAQARRRRSMTDRLTAATVRVEEQIEQRHAEEQAGQALTSFMPAIQRPPSDLPGMPPHGPVRRTAKERAARHDPARHDAAKDDAARHDHDSGHAGRRSPRSGEHKARGTDRSPHGEAAARAHAQRDSRPAP